MKRTAVVIGGGLAGLAAATELTTQSRGELEVIIVEKNRHLGGKMNVLSEKGFHFDMGPTIITMPEIVTELSCWNWLRLPGSVVVEIVTTLDSGTSVPSPART